MHASAVDAWSTHIINMLVEMDVVFVANDSTTSQGKNQKIKRQHVNVTFESKVSKKHYHHHHTEAVEFTVGRCTSPAVTPKNHSNAKLVLLKWSLIF